MPINRKRRIFRSNRANFGVPFRAVALTLFTSALVVSGGAFVGLKPTEAPVSTAPPGHIVASAVETRVIDGNTLMLQDRAVQLAGVRVADRGSVCTRTDGARVDCGAAAANILSDLIRGHEVDCAMNGAGQSGRPLAVCSAGGHEINLAMVASGWARAEPSLPTLGAAERQAATEHRGLWAR